MMDRMRRVASSPAAAIFGAGAVLANPGVFIPFALKVISETDPSSSQYIVEWLFFGLVSLLPLTAAIVMLLVARDWAQPFLGLAGDWLEQRTRVIAAVIIILLAASLLRGGIAGLRG